MDWITNTIAIGNYLDAQDKDALSRAGIKSVLSLDGTLTSQHAQDMGLSHVVTTVLIDGAGNDLHIFAGAVESLMFLTQAHAPVLVQCHAGRSRSVAVVAGYLMRIQDIDPDVAIEQVTSKREAKLASALKDLLYRLHAK